MADLLLLVVKKAIMEVLRSDGTARTKAELKQVIEANHRPNTVSDSTLNKALKLLVTERKIVQKGKKFYLFPG